MVSKSARRRSIPSKRIAPPTMRPGGDGISRRIDSELTVLPDPDSPTSPTISPGRTANETSSTTRFAPSSVSNSTVRPSISSNASVPDVGGAVPSVVVAVDVGRRDHDPRDAGAALALAADRVDAEGVAQAVTQQVEREHGRSRSRAPGYTICHGSVKIFSYASLQHHAPARSRRLETDAEEAQGGLGEQHRAERERRLHDDGRRDVGEHASHEDPPRTRSDRLRRLDERLLADGKRLRADQGG